MVKNSVLKTFFDFFFNLIMNDSVLFQVQFRTLGKALCNLSRSLNDLNGGKTSVVMFIGSCRNIFFVTRADAVTESVKYYRLYNSTEVRFISFLSGGFTMQEVPAFHNFRICDPRLLVVWFQALIL